LGGGFSPPPGVDPDQFAKIVPLFVGGLTQCGDSSSLINALNVYTTHQEFIQMAIKSVAELEKRAKQASSTGGETYDNPFVEGALRILTSDGMTELIKDATFVKLSDSLNLTCVLNRPDMLKQLNTSSEESYEKARSQKKDIDTVTNFIEGGLLEDMAPSIGPAFVECGGNLRILMQFAQAFSYFIMGNRIADSRDQTSGGGSNPALDKYDKLSPQGVYTTFQCADRGF